MRLLVVALCLLLVDCTARRERRLIEVAADECIGGKINTVKRITDTNTNGRLRNTVITTDACLY
jgi:hypothetical protein